MREELRIDALLLIYPVEENVCSILSPAYQVYRCQISVGVRSQGCERGRKFDISNAKVRWVEINFD